MIGRPYDRKWVFVELKRKEIFQQILSLFTTEAQGVAR